MIYQKTIDIAILPWYHGSMVVIFTCYHTHIGLVTLRKGVKMILTINKMQPIKNQVYDAIKNSIINFQFPPGQRLSEKELSVKLNVSRTPVREAFIRLAQDGLLEVVPQRGTFVSSIHLKDVYESNFIRESLEAAVIRELVEKITDNKLDTLENIIQGQIHANNQNDIERFYKLDEKFHETLFTLSGYSKTWDFLQVTKVQMDRVRYLSLSLDLQVSTNITEHQHIVRALGERDAEQAESVLRHHIKTVKRVVQRLSSMHEDYFIY
jgi:DNA-binding GntR family transcriptional regulator